MEIWGDEQVFELINTLSAIIAALDIHTQYLAEVTLGIETLEARSLVTTSAFQSLLARVEKLEDVYGDGK